MTGERRFEVDNGESESRPTTASADIVSLLVDASSSDVGCLVYLRLNGPEGGPRARKKLHLCGQI